MFYLRAAVNGITEAIDAAASSLVSGHVLYGSGELLNANQNRRMDQYNMNPEEERNRYEYTVDKEMIMLKFETVEAIPIGAFSWYPLHPLSFNQRETNPLGKTPVSKLVVRKFALFAYVSCSLLRKHGLRRNCV